MSLRGQRFRPAALLVVLAGACSTPPKPPELEAFEKLRSNPAASAATKRAPDLMTNADRLLAQAQEQWQSNDLEEARSTSLMGQIKLKHALALTEQDKGKRRIVAADEEIAKADEENSRLQRDLSALNDQLSLLKKLTEAAAERQQLADQLSAAQQKASVEKQTLNDQLVLERQKASAGEKIADAELALKTADTVKADTYAKLTYSAAVDMLARAQQELSQGNFKAAETSADMAKTKAGEAAAVAKPIYTQEAQSAENKTRAEALSRDAAAIAGISLRRDARGSLQRLVLPLSCDALFNKRETTVAPGKGGMLEGVASLLKKYSTFPVQVIGYTDTRGRAADLLSLSLARAQSVFSELVLRGVDVKRMLVSGQGGAEPVSSNSTVPGRAQNNRVEIIFLYQ